MSQAMLDRARRDVWRELERADLATPRLARVRVTRPWLLVSDRVGYYSPRDDGTIAVAAVSLGRYWEYRREAPWTGVRDVLRHEYAHALADRHDDVVRRGEFERAFGGGIDDEGPAGAYHPARHVSRYAATAPGEDFAETVMLYLRVGGAIDGYRKRPGLHAKLRFVADLPRWLRREPG